MELGVMASSCSRAGLGHRACCRSPGIAQLRHAGSHRRRHSPSVLAALPGTSGANKSPLRRRFQPASWLPPAAPAFPLLLPLSIFFFPFPALLLRGTLVLGSGRCQHRGCGQARLSFKVTRCQEERGALGTPAASCPCCRPGMPCATHCHGKGRRGELPKGFPHPEQQHLALFPRQNPPEYPWLCVRLTRGMMHVWVSGDQDHSNVSPSVDPT